MRSRRCPLATGRHVPNDRWDEALSLFESLEPLPVNTWGMAPVWLWFTADFRLRSPHGGVWPAQDPKLFDNFQTPGGISLGTSSTRLVLEAKRSLGLSISIPNATDDDLVELVPWLQGALPMRLSWKHWTRWTITKNGRSYRGRKIAPPLLALQPTRDVSRGPLLEHPRAAPDSRRRVLVGVLGSRALPDGRREGARLAPEDIEDSSATPQPPWPAFDVE